MEQSVLRARIDGLVEAGVGYTERAPDTVWTWVDVVVGRDEHQDLADAMAPLGLDADALDAVFDELSVPKTEEFGDHVHVVLHDVVGDRIAACAVSCFITGWQLVTVRHGSSPSVDALRSQIERVRSSSIPSPDVLLGILATILCRRQLSVLEVFENRVEDLVGSALAADPMLLGEAMAIRADIAVVRRSAQPQREALDQVRSTSSPVLTDDGLRRFTEAFGVADRVAEEAQAARELLREIVDGYRAAEAAQANDVTRVLTLYAAVVLPLSLLTGFFGMNLVNLPAQTWSWGWVVITAVMLLATALSVGLFTAQGWIPRLSGRQVRRALGRGLVEAARAPVSIGRRPTGM